jgi:hypothetical protein
MAGVWTNNWKGVKNAFLCGDFIPGISTVVNSEGNLVVTQREDSQGSVDNRGPRSYCSPMGAIYTSYYNTGNGAPQPAAHVALGGSAAAPTVGDYALNEPLGNISYLTAVKERPTYDTAAGTVSATYKVTVQNTKTEAQTVREWGLFTCLYGATSGICMYYHATLDSPVTLQPNQSATLTLTLSVTITDPV